jgi:signal transduction histidine kinase
VTVPTTRSRRLLYVAFAAIGAILVTVQVVTIYHLRAVDRGVRAIVGDALEGIRLVDRIRADLIRERLLADAHIVASGPMATSQVDVQLAALRADYEACARAYAPLVNEPDEAAAFARLQDDVAATRLPLERALRLSREDHDEEARSELATVEHRFVAVGSDADELVRINHDAAVRDLADITRVQRAGGLLVTLLAVLGVLLTALIAVSVTRVIHGWEESLRRRAALLEERNRSLDSFAARVAHDLREPLSAISVGAEQGRAEIVARGVARMESIIASLVALSRVEGRREANSDPSRVALALGEELGRRFDHDGARLQLDLEPASVTCSEGLLHRVLLELVTGALRRRRPEVHALVEIVGRNEGDGYELQISDNGFPRTDDSRLVGEQRPCAEGFPVARRVIEAAGGTAIVEPHRGPGTTIILRLPRS